MGMSRLQLLSTTGFIFSAMAGVLLLLLLAVEPINSQPAKPIVTAKDEVDERDLACAACLAIVDIVEKEMVKKSFDGVESRLYDLLEKVCDQNNYRTYDYIPPKMAEACKKFVDKNEDEVLVAAFQKFYGSEHKDPRNKNLIERKICLNVSGDCIGNKRLEGKSKQQKSGTDTPEQDKQFDANVEDLIAKHGHKVKQPTPVKHEDEL